MGLKIAVAGATGAVGREMVRLVESCGLPVDELRPLASSRSAGTRITFRGSQVEVQEMKPTSFAGIDYALFSAGASRSREFAPPAVEAGAVVIDNSSAFRMDPEVPLVVPEVNPDAARAHKGIIANPNCSTIQLVLPLKVLADAPGIERVVVATYQSASGAGQSGIEELIAGSRAVLSGEPEPQPSTFAHPLAFECLPHIGQFEDSGYTNEELKLTNETRKIMSLPQLDISATCVRVPVTRSHSESVTVDLSGPVDLAEVRERMDAFPNLVVRDDPARNIYPLARVAENQTDTYVGRLRRDINRSQTLHFWVVSDNLLKGAAFNAVQILTTLAEA